MNDTPSKEDIQQNIKDSKTAISNWERDIHKFHEQEKACVENVKMYQHSIDQFKQNIQELEKQLKGIEQ